MRSFRLLDSKLSAGRDRIGNPSSISGGISSSRSLAISESSPFDPPSSRKLALASFKTGNKQAAYRHIRQSKLFSESRTKCTSLLERVEEVLRESLQMLNPRRRFLKPSKLVLKQSSFKSLIRILLQKQVNEALEAMPLQSGDFDDEDLEEEFMKIEMELADEMPSPATKEPTSYKEETKET